MPNWEGSTRRSRLPPDWSKRVKAQLKADGYRCTAKLPDGSRCPVTYGLEVDHVEAMKDDHDRLQTLCSKHHGQKSGQEGAAARAALLAKARKKFLRTEQHPGLL